MTTRPDILKHELIAMLAAHPALADDDKLRADTFDAELDFPEAIERLVDRLYEREAYAASNDALASQYIEIDGLTHDDVRAMKAILDAALARAAEKSARVLEAAE